MNPGTQHLVKRVETKELDSAITDIEMQIQELEVRGGAREGVRGRAAIEKQIQGVGAGVEGWG